MKAYSILSICFLLPFSAFTQIQNDFENRAINQLLNEHYFRSINKSKMAFDYKGSPYENEGFEKGSLITNNKQEYKDVPLRYNIYNDEIEFKNDDNIMALENPNQFEFITIGKSKYVYLPFTSKKIAKKGYFKVIEEGKASLFVKPKVALSEAVRPGPYKDAVPATFSRTTDEIYVKTGDKEPQLVAGKKSFEEIFSDKPSQVAGFLKENKIKANNVDDVLKLVKFYNAN
jgi:hypothetical protein